MFGFAVGFKVDGFQEGRLLQEITVGSRDTIVHLTSRHITAGSGSID
jgi:hypothetical protein